MALRSNMLILFSYMQVHNRKEEHLLMAFPEDIPALFLNKERFEVRRFEALLDALLVVVKKRMLW